MRIHPAVPYWNQRGRLGSLAMPVFAPDEDGTGVEGTDTTQGSEGEDTLEGGESGKDAEINVDGVDAISKLFATSQDDDDDDDDSVEILTADQVKEYLDNGLKNVVAVDALIPDDFNPSDKDSMKNLLTNVMQLTAKHTLNLMFRPVENAMRAHAKEVRTDVKGRIGGLKEGNSTKEFLAREIPASQNPKYAALVQTAWGRALEIYTKPEDRPKAVKMVKDGLKAMSIDLDDSGEPKGRRGESGGSLRTGAAALDLYAPKPKAAATAGALKRQ